jgi:hypothetical protein
LSFSTTCPLFLDHYKFFKDLWGQGPNRPPHPRTTLAKDRRVQSRPMPFRQRWTPITIICLILAVQLAGIPPAQSPDPASRSA